MSRTRIPSKDEEEWIKLHSEVKHVYGGYGDKLLHSKKTSSYLECSSLLLQK